MEDTKANVSSSESESESSSEGESHAATSESSTAIMREYARVSDGSELNYAAFSEDDDFPIPPEAIEDLDETPLPEPKQMSLADMFGQATKIIVGVSITMLSVAIIVRFLNPRVLNGAGSGGYGGAYGIGEMTDVESVLGLFGLSTAETFLLIIIGSIVNATLFLILIVVVTFVVLFLYKIHCTRLLWGYMMFSSGLLLILFGGFTIYEFVSLYNFVLDYITLAIFLVNFTAAGILSIFWKSPRRITQLYLITVSILMASALTKLPEWTTWIVLFVIALWDIFAVLAPFGPLKLLVKTAQERNEDIPGLIYEIGSVAERPDSYEEILKLETKNEVSVRLGLGDFVFYSVLIGRAALFDFSTLFVCFIVVIMGLIGTLMILSKVKKPLPALPFSILLGIFAYYCTRYMLSPMIYELGIHLVFF